MKLNLRESKKTILKITSLITILITTIAVIFIRQGNLKSVLTEAQIFENKVAKNYNELTVEDKATNVDNVKFGAYFLRDLEGNNVAHMLDGTCKKLSDKDELYFDIQVNGDSYIENAKIEITNANFITEFNYLKDDFIKKNYVGNYDTIEFNKIDGGSEELIKGVINSIPITNYNDYSKTAIIRFTCEYHDIYTEEVTLVEKEVPITVDWYGSLETRVEGAVSTYYPSNISDNTIKTNFTVYATENLIIKDRKIEIKIPNLRDWEPINARLSNDNAIWNAETKTLTLNLETEFDENGQCRRQISNYDDYTIYITYPEEAFAYDISGDEWTDDLFRNRETINCEIDVTTTAYNNQGSEFENILTSENQANSIIRFAEEEDPDPVIGEETYIVEYSHRHDPIYLDKILENYNSVKSGEIEADNITGDSITGSFNTTIVVERGALKDYSLIQLEENNFKFGKYDATKYLKDVKIDYSEISEILEDDGSMMIYNAETNELIKELSITEIKNRETVNIPENVAKVKIELRNLKKGEGIVYKGRNPRYAYRAKRTHIYIEKELDVNALVNDLDYTTIKNLATYYSNISQKSYLKETNTLDKTSEINDSSSLRYAKSKANISVDPTIIRNSNETEEGEEENDEVIGQEIKITVKTKNDYPQYTNWSKGEFIIELPSNFEYFKLDSVSSNICEINGYEYFEENGKKLVRVFANTDATISFDVKAHVLVDPISLSGTNYINLYYKNEACQDYYDTTTEDIYDVDLNGDKNEIVGYSAGSITTSAPSTMILQQKVSNYDNTGAFVIAPNIAEVDKDTNSATIEIGIKNNNEQAIKDCYLLGKIPYEGNTRVRNNVNLESTFTTTMSSEGIIVPEELTDVTVYYSEKDSTNFDLNDQSNEWKTADAITDWNKVKTYLIDLSNRTIKAGERSYIFKYNITVPNGIDFNDVSYATVALKYNLQTSEGQLFERGAEAKKTGIRIVRKYDLNVKTIKENTQRAIPNETYIIEKLDEENNVVKTKIGKTNSDGNFYLNNLYANTKYKMYQTIANENYEADKKIIYFTMKDNGEGKLVFEYADDQSDTLQKDPVVSKESETNKDILNISIERTPKYKINISKLDRATEEAIKGIQFTCEDNNGILFARTDKEGKATISELSEGIDYTLKEAVAKGYYLQETTIKVSKDAQYNYSLELGNTEFASSYKITNTDQEDLVIVDMLVYNDSVPTYTLKVVKVEESPKPVSSEETVKLAGADFEIKKYDDDETEKIRTDEDGTAIVNNMYIYKEGLSITGKYGLQEINAPNGYVLNKEYIEFYVTENEDGTLKIEYKNKDSLTTIKDTVIDEKTVTIYIQDKSLFKLTKTDDDQALLPNVAFAIYELDTNGNIIDFAKDVNDQYIGTKNANNVYEVRTDVNGEIRIPLRDGDYILYEIEAPEQYEYSTEGRKFSVAREEEIKNESDSEESNEKFLYSVQYYYDGQRDDEKTEIYEVDKDTEVTTYVDKVQDGYELQYVTKLPCKIECDDLVIDVYYAKPKTETLEINYIEDLIDLQISVNNGNNYENTKVVLKRSLDFNDEDSYRDYAGTTYGDYNEDGEVKGIKEEVTTGRGWKSIGVKKSTVINTPNGDYVLDSAGNKQISSGLNKLKYFSGTFDGNNNSISNMYVDFRTSTYKDSEYQENYSAALFGWTYEATIMNLKFSANIYGNVDSGAGLVGTSYGSINVFNVENTLTGYFNKAGIIGLSAKRINYYDRKNTNINIQNITNKITGEKGLSYIGAIGEIETLPAHDPAIKQMIEINKVDNSIEVQENGTLTYSGTIGFIGSYTNYQINDKIDIYSINSNIEAYGCSEVGGAIGDAGSVSFLEYKVNNIKSKINVTNNLGRTGGAIGYISYKGPGAPFIENFDSEIQQTESSNGMGYVGGAIGHLRSENPTIITNIEKGKSNIKGPKASYVGGVIGYNEETSIFISDVTAYGNISGSSTCGGIAGYASGNLNIENSNSYINIDGGSSLGGIIGQINSSEANIEVRNSKNYGNISGSSECGGIVGYAIYGIKGITIENVNNYGNITIPANNSYVGGILGKVSVKQLRLKKVENYGNISGGYEVAGIAGHINSGAEIVEIEGCVNKGDINYISRSGGIIGETYSTINMNDCCNEGNIKTQEVNSNYLRSEIGGLVGYSSGAEANIINSYNKGNIELNASSIEDIGGILGYGRGTIENSYNDGDIICKIDNGGHWIGGILGNGKTTIKNCYNVGKILIENNSEDYIYGIGGIAGYNYNCDFSNVINQGEIDIKSFRGYDIGGIVGGINLGNITNACNFGKINVSVDEPSSNRAGGIAGYSYAGYSNATIRNCYNVGKIVSTTGAGGIVGENDNRGEIIDCYNEGDIKLYGEKAGGIAASNSGKITNTYNIGNVITSNNEANVGPIAGTNDENNGEIINSYYSDKINIIGANINEYGTKQKDNYMKTREFYDTLNTNNVWVYLNNQYPKLIISAGEETAPATELNIVNNHKICNISTSLNNAEGGTITGYDQEILEEVKYGESNKTEILMTPSEGYEISKVTINGKEQQIELNEDGTYKIAKGQIENIKIDTMVYVEFLKKNQILTIEKVDKDTNEKLANATFDISLIESVPITDEISELKESNISSENAADINNLVDEVIGTPEMIMGTYTLENETYEFSKTNDGGRYYKIESKIPVDLTGYTGKYIIRFESNDSWDSCYVYNVDDTYEGSMRREQYIGYGYSYTYVLTGGKAYYLQLKYSDRSSSGTKKIENLHVYATNNNTYNMITTDEGYFETTNPSIPLATSAGYIEVDLKNHPENYYMSIKYNNNRLKFDTIITNVDTEEKLYTRSSSTSYSEGTEQYNLPGGAKYKVEFRYENNTGSSSKIQIKEISINVNKNEWTKITKTTNSEGQLKVQIPAGRYAITEIKAPEHYLDNAESVEYNVEVNKENKVIIENTHKPVVRVHHYLMENGEKTEKRVSADEYYEGNVDEEYYFNPRNDLEGLSLAKDDDGELIIPDNYKGKYTLGVTDVNFYYEAEKIKLKIHHYENGTQTKVADDETIEKDAQVTFEEDNSYTISTTETYKTAENEQYRRLTQDTYDLTKVYSSEKPELKIGDTLEYNKDTELTYNYDTKKYRIVTRIIEHDELETTEGETAAKTVSVKGGTISGSEFEFYEELASNANSTKDIIVTPDKGYKIKEIKLNGTVVYDVDHTANDLYTVANGVVTFNKFNNISEDKTITAEFESIGSNVKVHYIITEEGKEDVEHKTLEIKGRVGTRYKTAAIEIEGYTMYSSSLNVEGEIEEKEINVYYYYKENPDATYTIKYFYNGVEDTNSVERIVGKTKTTITMENIQTKIEEHKKENYEFEKAENIPLMLVNDVDEYVIKIYYTATETYGTVIEKHIDKVHETVLYTEKHNGKTGENYEIKSRTIEGYTLLEKDSDENSLLPKNATGTYKENTTEEVKYYYARNTTVKVVYQDEKGKELEKDIIEGHEGDKYTTEEKTIKGYKIVEIPENAKGTMTVIKDTYGKESTETVVTYNYKKLIPADVIEKYVDINTNEPVDEVIHKGEIDEEYTITPKPIEGYTLITKDKDGNDILPEEIKGKYTEEKVEIVYYVAMNTTVRVQYINLITNEKMTDDIIINGYEGKEYVTEQKTFEGYELTGTPENARGIMKVTEKEDGSKVTELVVKYYYAQILDGKLPQTNETNSKQAILIAIPFVILINLSLATIAFNKNKNEDMTE
jgi:hypothetical protein